jgi:hypothetical protein
MIRISPVPPVGIPLRRALLCPNDDTVYDAERWKVCPTCQNEDRVFLSRILGIGAGNRGRTRDIHLGNLTVFRFPPTPA